MYKIYRCTSCYKEFHKQIPSQINGITVCDECYDKYFKKVSTQIPIKPMPTIEPLEDLIHKPNHYHKNEIDVNGYLEKHFPKQANVTVAEGFYIGNVIKYVSRHKEKGGMTDLDKAQFNLDKLKEMRGKNNE